MASYDPSFKPLTPGTQEPLYFADIFPDLRSEFPTIRRAEYDRVQGLRAQVDSETDPIKQGRIISQTIAIASGKELLPGFIPGGGNHYGYFAELLRDQFCGKSQGKEWSPLSDFYSSIAEPESPEHANRESNVALDPTGRYEFRVSGITHDNGRFTFIGSIFDRKISSFIWPDLSRPGNGDEISVLGSSKHQFIGIQLTARIQPGQSGVPTCRIERQLGVVLTPQLEQHFLDQFIKDGVSNPLANSITHAVKVLTGTDVTLGECLVSDFDSESGLKEVRATKEGGRIAWAFTGRNSPPSRVEVFGVEAIDQLAVLDSYFLEMEPDPVFRLREYHDDLGNKVVDLPNHFLEKIENLVASQSLKITIPRWINSLFEVNLLSARAGFLSINSKDPNSPKFRLHLMVALNPDGNKDPLLLELTYPPSNESALPYNPHIEMEQLISELFAKLPTKLESSKCSIDPELLHGEIKRAINGDFNSLLGRTLVALITHSARISDPSVAPITISKVALCHSQSLGPNLIEDIRFLVNHSLGTSVFTIYRNGGSGWIENLRTGRNFMIRNRSELYFGEVEDAA